MRRFAVVASAVALVCVGACSSSGSSTRPSVTVAPTTTVAPKSPSAGVAMPAVTGPVSGGTPDLPVNAMLAAWKQQYGYEEHEYFLTGTATAYRPVGTWRSDGRWNIAPTTRAPYKTRIIVRVPHDPAKFNGTVVVEWMNETSGRDADPDFGFAGPELLRDGFGYVAVSAQQVGVGGGKGLTLSIPGYAPKPLVEQNPARYGSLHHPGDDYSYDIFSQAAQSLLGTTAVRPLGGLRARHLIAAGESQSSFRMLTYADAVDPTTHLFDGFVIHSRSNNAAPITASVPKVPDVAYVRSDLGVPVMQLLTETDLYGLGFATARQPDTAKLRTWEMAGTSHADQSTLDYGITSGRQWDTTDTVPDFAAMCGRINDGPQRFVVRRAYAAMGTWVDKGIPPASAPPIATAGRTIRRDRYDNAIGGVRTPAVDVPTESLSGEYDATKSIICSLFGSSRPLPGATLATLYPSHAAYVAKVRAAAQLAVLHGFLSAADVAEITHDAQTAAIPR